MAKFKRYIAGVDSTGKSTVTIDDFAPNVTEVAPQLYVADIWHNFQTPADNTAADDPVQPELKHEPPEGGATFRIMSVPPQSDRLIDPDSMQRMHAKIASQHAPSADEYEHLKDPTMHKTGTLNYFVVVSGEIWMLTEQRDVLLRQGDVIVQLGCMHGWRNTGEQPAVVAGVMVDSKPMP